MRTRVIAGALAGRLLVPAYTVIQFGTRFGGGVPAVRV